MPTVELNCVQIRNKNTKKDINRAISIMFDISTHLMSLVSFYTSWQHQSTSGFLFSGGTEREQRHKLRKYKITVQFFFMSDHLLITWNIKNEKVSTIILD